MTIVNLSPPNPNISALTGNPLPKLPDDSDDELPPPPGMTKETTPIDSKQAEIEKSAQLAAQEAERLKADNELKDQQNRKAAQELKAKQEEQEQRLKEAELKSQQVKAELVKLEQEKQFAATSTNAQFDETDQLCGLKNEETATVKVKHNEATAHLQSAHSWSDLPLSPELLKGIYEMHFIKPSKIQEVALPIIISSRSNLIGQAQNGSGKTATFALGMLAAIDTSRKYPQCICLTNTRELAKQTAEVVRKLGKHLDVNVIEVVPQGEGLRSKVYAHVCVGTAGKMSDLMKRGNIPRSGIRMCVLDEADIMLDMDNMMGTQVSAIYKMCPEDTQMLFFSATFPDSVRNFAMKIVKDPATIEVKKEDLTLKVITQMHVDCTGSMDKDEALCQLYAAMSVGQSVVFLNNRHEAFRVAKLLNSKGHAVSLICGSGGDDPDKQLSNSERDRVMQEFRSGVTKVLVATDVLSRGIDVPQVTLVINYELPIEFRRGGKGKGRGGGQAPVCMETYIHRIGRTGRFGLPGVAVNLCDIDEMSHLNEIKKFYKCEITQVDEDFELLEKSIRDLR